MEPILFLNHRTSQCGVYDYGLRLYRVWKDSTKYHFIYREVSSYEEYRECCSSVSTRVILYNFQDATMPWLHHETISKQHFNIGLIHECNPTFFNVCLNAQSDIVRPLFTSIPDRISTTNESIIAFLQYGLNSGKPIIGSFGFGFNTKGFDKIISHANREFDEAIIKLITPYATYGDPNSYVSNLCHGIVLKPGIEVKIIHDYLDSEDVLYFLNHNTINLFLYDYQHGRGISSAIDYALSVHRPLGISDSYMFRHIYDDSICVNKRSISYCMEHSMDYLQKYKEAFSPQKSIEAIENRLHQVFTNL
jgi:hypothetical protein